MKKRPVSIALAFGLALALGAGPAVVYAEGGEANAEATASEGLEAASVDESQDAALETEAEDEGAPADDGEPGSFMGLEADSFRYRDGKPIEGFIDTGGSEAYDDELTAMADLAWRKNSSGKYVSSNGSVINGTLRRGVDVSEFQGQIDWARAKADDVGFAILRCGGTFSVSRKQYNDDTFERNASECQRLNIPYGVYFFSTAMSVEDAIKEADFTIAKLQGKNVTLPVYYDLEYEEAAKKLSTSDWAAITKAFCDRIAAAGYTPGVYASLYWWEHHLTDPIFANWTRWVAQYYSRCEYGGTYDCWQCSSSVTVDGIPGMVDLNFAFGLDKVMGRGDNPSAVWNRIWGETYFDTMQAVNQEEFDHADTVVIATAAGYWDALSASAVAGKYDAPILLSDPGSVPSQTISEIKRLGARTAYLIGGTSVLSEQVERERQGAGIQTIERIWGEMQWDTADRVAEHVGQSVDTCIIATSLRFEDALSASPLAYVNGYPILLSQKDRTLSNDTLNVIQSMGFKRVIIIGGPNALKTEIEDQLAGIGISGSNVVRKYGETAYDTSAVFASYCMEAEDMSANGMAVATGIAYWDALTGAPLCGQRNAVMVLADARDSSAIDNFVKPNAGSIKYGSFLGGNSAISYAVYNAFVSVTG